MSLKKCPVCESSNVLNFINILQMPIYCNRLCSTREEAFAAPKGDIQLGCCLFCGHVFNIAFQSYLMEYDQEYENSLHFSPRFQAYAETLAKRLIKDYDLYYKDIIEIGCGKGDFLELLCKLGKNRGLGFDPSFEKNRIDGNFDSNFQVINDYFSERHRNYPADLICCRQVLEHIQHPREFLNTVRNTIGKRISTIVFFEVPDVMYTLKDMGIWDLIYEHCGYFTLNSLRHFFKVCGFEVLKIQNDFEGQFLCIEARSAGNKTSECEFSGAKKDVFLQYVFGFSENYFIKTEGWKVKLDKMKCSDNRIVVWGAGSKGVTFLNVLRNSQNINYVVDINPHKLGRFVPGTGQEVVPPSFLEEYKPEVILVMNPNYLSEIMQRVEQLCFEAQFLVV